MTASRDTDDLLVTLNELSKITPVHGITVQRTNDGTLYRVRCGMSDAELEEAKRQLEAFLDAHPEEAKLLEALNAYNDSWNNARYEGGTETGTPEFLDWLNGESKQK